MATTPEAKASPAADVARGRSLYNTACAACHGPDGSGAVMRSVMPELSDLSSKAVQGLISDSQMLDVITKGRNKMPPFGKLHQPDAIQAIIAYTRTLARQ